MNEEQRCYYRRFSRFAIDCSLIVSKLDWKKLCNRVWGKQLISSSGSVGANYIEAIEGSSTADFIYRLKICRKEANESVHWLHLLGSLNQEVDSEEFDRLIREAREFAKMFSSAIKTAEKKLEKKDKNGK